MFSMSWRSSPGGRKGVWSSAIIPFSAVPSGQFVRFRMSDCANLACESGSTAPRFICLIMMCSMAHVQNVCSQDRQLAEKSRNSYAVVSADRFITAGHQNTSFFGSKNRSALSNSAWSGSDFEGVQGESDPSVLTDFPMPAPRCWRQSKNVGVVYAGR